MLFLTILLLIVLFVVYNLVLIVHVREVCVIERLGKFRAVLDAGLHFLIPFVDRVAYRHETRVKVFYQLISLHMKIGF